jgi:glucose-1-phosphate cytidylyltransferase
MKIVVLAGGLGTRLAEETDSKPKPMVEIGGRPILYHILKHFGVHGFDDFIIALGYRGDSIKRYFLEQVHLAGDLVVDGRTGKVTALTPNRNPWKISLIETGLLTNTGGRVRQLRRLLGGEPFMVTYGDGVSDVPIDRLVAFHRRHGKLATVTAVRPPARFGGLTFNDDNDNVSFVEKPQIGEGWINGGFLVFDPAIFDYLSDDQASLEVALLERLSAEGQLAAYRHEGFWQCMDTLRDLRFLQALWERGKAPWKTWQDD